MKFDRQNDLIQPAPRSETMQFLALAIQEVFHEMIWTELFATAMNGHLFISRKAFLRRPSESDVLVLTDLDEVAERHLVADYLDAELVGKFDCCLDGLFEPDTKRENLAGKAHPCLQRFMSMPRIEMADFLAFYASNLLVAFAEKHGIR